MEVSVSRSYECKFAVRAFYSTEGGMETRTYEEDINTLEQALIFLDAANIKEGDLLWTIEVEVGEIGSNGGAS